MRSISDFIQEQESGIYSDISLEKAYAECAAALSLAKCYSEQALIMEFAEENGIDSLNIIQESGDEEKKENIFKRAGVGIKNVWAKIIKFFKAIYRRILMFITEKKLNALLETAKTIDDNVKIKDFDIGYLCISDFIYNFNEMMNSFVEWDKNDTPFDFEAFNYAFENLKTKGEKYEEVEGSYVKLWIKEKFDRKSINNNLKEIDKKIKELEKSAKATDKNEKATDADKTKAAEQRELASKFSKLVNVVTATLDYSIKRFNEGWPKLKKLEVADSTSDNTKNKSKYKEYPDEDIFITAEA